MGQIGKSKVQINYHGNQPSYCSGDTWCIVDLTNLTNLKTSYKVLYQFVRNSYIWYC